jgi:hypothetical protein
MQVPPFFVHVWSPTERVTSTADRSRYVPDPNSGRVLSRGFSISQGRVFQENSIGSLVQTIRADARDAPIGGRAPGMRESPLPVVPAGRDFLGFLLYAGTSRRPRRSRGSSRLLDAPTSVARMRGCL